MRTPIAAMHGGLPTESTEIHAIRRRAGAIFLLFWASRVRSSACARARALSLLSVFIRGKINALNFPWQRRLYGT